MTAVPVEWPSLRPGYRPPRRSVDRRVDAQMRVVARRAARWRKRHPAPDVAGGVLDLSGIPLGDLAGLESPALRAAVARVIADAAAPVTVAAGFQSAL